MVIKLVISSITNGFVSRISRSLAVGQPLVHGISHPMYCFLVALLSEYKVKNAAIRRCNERPAPRV